MFIKKSSVLLGLFVALSFSPLCSFANDDIVINNDNFINHSGVEGGAISTIDTKNYIINSTNFNSNTASKNGGAIYSNSTISIINSNFTKNTATTNGGAIYNLGDLTVGGIFKNNEATKGSGGAIFNSFLKNTNYSGKVTILYGTKFESNYAKKYGGAIHTNVNNVIVSDNVSFIKNKAQNGAAISVQDSGNIILQDNIDFISNESTSHGGAVYSAYGGNFSIGKNARFINNVAGGTGGHGGAIYAYNNKKDGDRYVIIGENALFENNSCVKYGGAIYNGSRTVLTIGNGAKFISNHGTSKYSLGGAIYNIGNGLNIGDNSEFISNSAIQGGAIFHAVDTNLTLSKISFDNNSAIGNDTQSAGGALFITKEVTKDINIKDSIFQNNNATVSGGAILQGDGSTAKIIIDNSLFSNNKTGAEGGAIVSDSALQIKNSIFEGNNTTKTNVGTDYRDTSEGGGAIFLYDNGQATIENSTFVGNSSGTYGGAIGTRSGTTSAKLDINHSVFDSNTARVQGGAINTFVDATITDSTFTNNSAGEKGGAIFSTSNLTIKADKYDVIFSSNSAKDGSDIFMNGNTSNTNPTLSLISSENKTITFASGISGTDNGYDINIDGKGTVKLDSYIKNANVTVNGNLLLGNNSNINNNNNHFTFNNGSSLSTINNKIDKFNDGLITINGDANISIDIDMNTGKGDYIGNLEIADGTKLNLSNIKALPNITKNNLSVNIYDAIGVDSSKLNIDESNVKILDIMTPIRRMSGSISNGIVSYAPSSNGWRNYNPSILATPVAAIAGTYLTQLNSYDQAFMNMDMYMLMSYSERQAMKFANKYAEAQNNDTRTDVSTPFNLGLTSKNSTDAWFRPFASFEKVGLRNGPKISNSMYGSFFGGDSKLYSLPKGWDGMYSVYVGYNGSHQSYNGISIYQNGVQLGFTGIAYKGNFFAGATVNVGANIADASTFYGSDDFTMLMTGAALKTGYNFEMANGKFIIQPHVTVSYSFINTFDYTNSAGVRIKSDPFNAIAVQPGVKLIGNLKHGWQPYAGISLIWNFLDDTKFKANDISLPEMSIKPFIRYHIGVQKRIGERFTGFGQIFFNTLGRSGIGFSFGFKWSLGRTLPQKLPEPVYVHE